MAEQKKVSAGWRAVVERARARSSDTAVAGVGTAPRRHGLQDGVPTTLRVAAGWSWRMLVVAAALAVVVYLVITFKIIVVAILVALLLAVLLDPVAAWLRRVLHFPRTLAALAGVLGLITVVGGLLALAGRSIVEGFGALADQVGLAFEDLRVWLNDGPLGIDEAQIDEWLAQIRDQVESNSGVLVSGVVGLTGSATSVLTGGVIALFCLFFFLREGRSMWHWFVRLAPVPARESINEAGIRGWLTLGGYTRTQITVAAVDAAGIGVGAAILGLPLALPIGILVFLFSFIPIIGAIISGSVAVLVALVDQGVVTALIMLGIVLLVQQIESNILQPWLQGNALSLHPVAVLLAVAAGTGLAGVLGALFAVPLVGTVNTVLLYLYGHDKYPSMAERVNRPGGPPGALDASLEHSFDHVADSDTPVEDDGEVALAEAREEGEPPGTDRPGRPR